MFRRPWYGLLRQIQTSGRILRKVNIEDYKKKSPIVDDLIDVGFPSIFIPDLKAKKKVMKEEFNCEIIDISESES